MELKKLLGDDYKEGMTAEEIAAAIADKNFIEKKHFDKAASEAAAYKKQLAEKAKEAEGAKQSAEGEKTALEKRIEELERQAESAVRESQISKLASDLMGLGYEAELAKDTATAQLDGDFTKVIANQQAFLQAMQQKEKKNAAQNTPPPPAGGAQQTAITKEAFAKMTIAERTALALSDKATYDALRAGN